MQHRLLLGALAASGAVARAQAAPILLSPQPVSAALQALARETGVQILFTPAMVRGHAAPQVSALSVEAALNQILAPARLGYRRMDGRTYAIILPWPPVTDSLRATGRDPSALVGGASQAGLLVPILTVASEVVVLARPSPTEVALEEQQLRVGVSNTLSTDQIRDFPVGSVADLAPLIPGLAQHRDEFQGQAATGEGQYITIRGFDTAYNAYSLDGMRLAQTDTASRAVAVNLFSPFGLSSILVDKAPTSDQDGDSIAGVLDFRTPGAFDSDGAHLTLRAQSQVAQQALQTHQAAGGGALQMEYADRLAGDPRLGVYVSGYYQDKRSTAEEVAAQNAPVVDNDLLTGTPRANPDNLAMNGEQWNFYREAIQRYGGDLALGYRGETTEIQARLLYAHYRNDMTQDQQSLRTSTIAGQSPPPTNNAGDAMPGLDANTGAAETEYNATTGAYSPFGVQPGHYFQYNEYDQDLLAAQLNGRTRFPALGVTMTYGVGYSWGEYAQAQHYEGGQWGAPYIGPAAGNGPGVASQGVVFDLADPARPTPVLSPQAAAYVYNPASTRAWNIDAWRNSSQEGLLTLKDDLQVDVRRGWLDAIKAGFKYERALRESDDAGDQADERVYVGLLGVSSGAPDQPLFYQGQGPTTAAFPGNSLNSFMGGAYPGLFKLTDVAAYKTLWSALEAANPANEAAAAAAYADSRITGAETRYAGYAEAVFTAGALSVLPGVRYELNQDRFRSFETVDTGGGFVTAGRSYGELLPGVSLTYRPDALSVYRASIRKSYARPAFDQLYGATSVVNTDGETVINEPNPNLKPVETINYDLGFERYDHRGGVLQLDAYYKSLKNVIFAAGATNTSTDVTGNLTTTSGQTTINTTVNGLGGEAYGLEANVRKRLTRLPSPLDGFGLGGNLTVQTTRANYALSPMDVRSAPLPNAPDLLYNLELFYDRQGIRGSLDYSYQGLALEQLQTDEPDIYSQSVKTLNFSTSYTFLSGLRIGMAIQNLLDRYSYWATYGKSARYLAQGANNEGGFVETGRVFLMTLAYGF